LGFESLRARFTLEREIDNKSSKTLNRLMLNPTDMGKPLLIQVKTGLGKGSGKRWAMEVKQERMAESNGFCFEDSIYDLCVVKLEVDC
jgi:hypothetical protein